MLFMEHINLITTYRDIVLYADWSEQVPSVSFGSWTIHFLSTTVLKVRTIILSS